MYYINKNVFGKVLFGARLFLLHTHTHIYIYTDSQSHNVKFTCQKSLKIIGLKCVQGDAVEKRANQCGRAWEGLRTRTIMKHYVEPVRVGIRQRAKNKNK